MDRISRNAFYASVLFILTWGAAAPPDAPAATLRYAKTFVLPRAETIHDDLYAGGTMVDVQGVVDGDLVAAGQTVIVSGTVTGDVIAAARDVTITGSVGGTIRAAGNNINIDGPIGHDLVVACGTLATGSRATVGRDVLAGAGNTSFGGRITRDVRVGSRSTTFSGTVGGTVYARAQEVHLADGADLQGDLLYTSRNELEKSQGAVVHGRVERRVPQGHHHRRDPAAPVIGWMRGLIGLLILGALFWTLFVGAGRRSVEALQRSPWASLGLGLVIALVVPCAIALFFIVGVIFGGWWIAIGAAVLYLFALAVGYVIASASVGTLILARTGSTTPGFVWTILVGLVVLGILAAIPIVGNLVGFLAGLFGVGALSMAWYRSRVPPRAATT